MAWMVIIWLSVVVITGFLIPLVALFCYLQEREIRNSSVRRRAFPCWPGRRRNRDIEAADPYHKSHRNVHVDIRSPLKPRDRADNRRPERVFQSERKVDFIEPAKRMRTTMRNKVTRQNGEPAGIAASDLRKEVHARFRAPLAPAAARYALRNDVERRVSIRSPRDTVSSHRATVHGRPTVETDEEWDSE